MKQRIIKIINFFVFLFLSIILLYFAFRDININELVKDIVQANYSWVILSLFIAFLAHLSRAYRWTLLIRRLGYRPCLINTFYAVMIAYLANFAFPRFGEFARCLSLKKTDNIPVEKLVGTVISERAFDLFILFILVFIVIIVKINIFGDFINTRILQPFLKNFFNNLTLYLTIIFLIIFCLALLYVFYKKNKNIRILKHIKELIRGMIEGLKTIFAMRRNIEFFIHSIFIWSMYFLMTYVVFFALESTSHLTLIDGLFIMVIGGLGISAPVQGGFGAYHWIVSQGLTLYGISREQGLVFATITHESQVLFFIVAGSLSILMIFVTKKNSKNNA